MADLDRLRVVLDLAHSALDSFAGLGLQAAVAVDGAGVLALRVNILGGALPAPALRPVGAVVSPDVAPMAVPVHPSPAPALPSFARAAVVQPTVTHPTVAKPVAVKALGVPRAKRVKQSSGGRNSHWDAAMEVELIRLYKVEGVPLSDIALRLGRTVKGVSVKLTRLRGAGRMTIRRAIVPREAKWSDQEIANLRKLWGTMPEAEVVTELGRTRGAVSSMVSRLGLSRANGAEARAKAAEQKSEPKAAKPVVVAKAAARIVEAPAPRAAPVAMAMPAPDPAPVVVVAPEPEPAVEAAPKPAPKAAPVQSHYRPEPVPIVEQDPVPMTPRFTMPKGAGLASAPLRGVDFSRAPARFLPGMTDRQKAEVVAAHIAGLAADPMMLATDDLDMCEAVFSGDKIGVWAALNEAPVHLAVARFNAIVAPMKVDGARGLPIEAASWVLPALRARCAEVVE